MNSYLAGGAAFAVLASAWSYVVWSLSYIRSMVLITFEVDHQCAEAVALYLQENAKQQRFGYRKYGCGDFRMRNTGRVQRQLYENSMQGCLYWVGWRAMWVRTTVDKSSMHETTVTFLRGTFRTEFVLSDAVRRYDEFSHEDDMDEPRFFVRVVRGSGHRNIVSSTSAELREASPSVDRPSQTRPSPSFRLITCSRSDIGDDPKQVASLDMMALTPTASRFINFARQWRQERDWYRERNIPWKIGCHIVGTPGSGKTTLIRALAQDLNMPVFIFDLSTLDNAELADAWDQVKMHSPAVALFEDIDAVFHKREPKIKDLQVSYDAVLQTMSGVEEIDGILICVTTNHEDHLDPALIRPGRAEDRVSLDELDQPGALKIAIRIMEGIPFVDIETLVHRLFDGGPPTGAVVQKEATEAALVFKRNLMLEDVEAKRADLRGQRRINEGLPTDQQLNARGLGEQ